MIIYSTSCFQVGLYEINIPKKPDVAKVQKHTIKTRKSAGIKRTSGNRQGGSHVLKRQYSRG